MSIKRECQTKDCNEFPSLKVFWPGKDPLMMCEKCAARAVKVGESIGCKIHVEPLINMFFIGMDFASKEEEEQ